MYKARADALKEAHKKAYPTYKYAPRKPSEKKRRVSKKNLTKPTKTISSINFPAAPAELNIGTFGLNAQLHHTNMVEQQLQPEHTRLGYGDETTGMNFAPADSWHMAQEQDLYTFFAPRQ